MKLLEKIWTSIAFCNVLFIGFVFTQDQQGYYFSSPITSQNRFVPSFPNTRPQGLNFLGGTRNSLSSPPGSFQDQLLFLSNDDSSQSGNSNLDQSHLSSGFAPFSSSQYSLQQTTRNPDFYDNSPRPFGAAGGTSSFTRSKAIRPSSSLSNSGFLPQSIHQTRTNVPHQQTQFLAHFNEQNSHAIEKNPFNSATVSSTTSGGGGVNGRSSLFGSNSNVFIRNHQPLQQQSNINYDITGSQQQQQLPFRNNRNRFHPSGERTTTTSTSTTKSTPTTVAISTAKATRPFNRYNRFGAGRSPPPSSASSSSSSSASSAASSGDGLQLPAFRTQSTTNSFQSSPPAAISSVFGDASILQRPRYTAFNGGYFNKTKLGTATSSGGFQPRRPLFISREINEPVHLTKNRPFASNTGRITINHSGGSDKIKTLGAASSSSASDDGGVGSSGAAIATSEELDTLQDQFEENHVGNGKNDGGNSHEEPPSRIFEKLSLHEAGAIPSQSTTTSATKSGQEDDHTVILTSNFFLPNPADASATFNQQQNDDIQENNRSISEEEGIVNVTDADVSSTESTTHRSNEYEYEYVVDDEARDGTTLFTTTNNSEERETELATTTEEDVKHENASVIEATTVAAAIENEHDPSHDHNDGTSAEYDEDDYEDETENNEGSGADASGNESSIEIDDESISNSELDTKTTTPHRTANEIINHQIVSVVTTKSVINGSTAFPQPVTPSTTTLSSQETKIYNENKVNPAKDEDDSDPIEDQSVNNATKSYVVIASIQTSRSINGARFLPFPAIEQEETKQPLSELERKIHNQKIHQIKNKNSKNSTQDQATDNSSEKLSSSESSGTIDDIPPTMTILNSSVSSPSTESIIDKLDRVQSELSSGLLSGKFPIISEIDVSTQATTSTASGSKFIPNIRKFMPKTTARPKIHIEELPMDDLAGLLPPGFKPRPSYKNKKHTTAKFTTTTTTTTTKTTATEVPPSQHRESNDPRKQNRNSTIARSFKNSPIAVQDLSLAGLLSKSYQSSSTTTTEPATNISTNIKNIFKKIRFDDNLDKLLPNDYKGEAARTAATPKPSVTIVDDISKFLPPGYKPPKTTTTRKPLVTIKDDIFKLLPPGFKSAPPTSIDVSKLLPKDFKPDKVANGSVDLLKKIEFKDVSALLPPGFKANSSGNENTTLQPHLATTPTNSSNYKVVFPKGIHKRPGQRLTTSKPHNEDGPSSPPIVIKKGPPTRVTTEFTGWPTPSTTPISIEKLLEQSRTAVIDFADILPSAMSTTMATTTTTTTTPEPPKPTKPGRCQSECDLAGTIKIIEGVSWKPELLDHNTAEWKNLAREVESQLNEVYVQAKHLSKWYKKVRIDSFSKGSVLVDYFVELANISQEIDTLEIKKLFHQALIQPPLAVIPLESDEIQNDTAKEDNQMKESKGEKLVKETYLMGRFVLDPISTDFIVIPKLYSPTIEYAEEDALIPQWAVVLIVIGIGSLCFVIIFGVTVLLNRQKHSKKAPIPLTTDMLNELKINHMGGVDNYGADDFYNIEDTWNDSKQPIKPKRFTNSVHGSSASNIYDSWRSTRHGDFYYDSQNYSHSHKSDHLQHHQQHQSMAYPSDAFSDAHQLYTYNQSGRSRYHRDYDPDF